MKNTCLFSLMYLEGSDLLGNNRLDRNLRYVEYYNKLKVELGFSGYIFVDNASSLSNLAKFNATVVDAESNQVLQHGREDMTIIRYKKHLERGPGYDYPYCWRGLYELKAAANLGLFDKIIFIDTDAFIRSGKLAKHIRELNTGWETFWSPMYGFPEAAIQVVCEDSFDLLNNFLEGDFMHHNGKCMETTLPFTKINKDFVGDRYGENMAMWPKNPDYTCQTPLFVTSSFSP